MELDAHDPKTIKEKILPLFDDLLLERFRDKESKTVEILSTYLAQIIGKSAQNDLPALSHSLQSVISPAIAKEIADNKEKMVDALYPIMGGMISKYVSNAIQEMMEAINSKIEDGLSFERYKRKIKAKIAGVSESELLLEEAGDATIKSLFVIRKESGLLIAEAHLANQEIDDPHMVASMASAIKDFVNDWIQNTEETSEVQLLSYGNATLYIESAGSVYLIAFLDAEPDHEQRKKINSFFAKLVKRYSTFFQNFDGNDRAAEIKEIQKMMQEFLAEENPVIAMDEKKEKNPLKYLLAALLLLFLAYGAYLSKEKYRFYRLENEITQKTGEKLKIEREADGLHIKGRLSSVDALYPVRKLIQEKSGEAVVNELEIPVEEMDQKLKKHEMIFIQFEGRLSSGLNRLEKKISSLEQRIKEIESYHLQTKKLIEHTKEIVSIKESILKILNSDTLLKDMIQPDGSLDFKSKRLFEAGDALPKTEALSFLNRHFERYIRLLMGNKKISPYIKAFIIEGYTDSSGEEVLNKRFSLKRAKKIKKYLLSLPLSQAYHLEKMMIAKGLANTHPVMVDGREDKEASRRIKLRFELDKEKMIDMIKSRLQ